MMNRGSFWGFLLLILLVFADTGMDTIAQTKGKNSAPAKPKEVAQQQDQNSVDKSFTPEQIESLRQQCGQLIQFFAGTLNFLADKTNPVKEKETILTQSYLKIFRDAKVQVEDDLDENRKTTLNKDIPAYLADVDFFFRGARFQYTVQDVSFLTNQLGQPYFKVTVNRNLKAITVNNDSVNSNKVRYFEINYDDSKQELKIVSIYSTKIDEKEDLQIWWNGLSGGWKNVFGKDIKVNDTLLLSQVSELTDSTAMVNFHLVKIDGNRIFPLLLGIVNLKVIDISGNSILSDLEPLSKMSSLKEINISSTPVNDLMPLRNLNGLEKLDISGTAISSLEPLRYADNIKELRLKKTQIRSIRVMEGFQLLEVLDISQTPIDSLDALKEITSLRNLQCSGSQVRSLLPIAGLVNLEVLNISNIPVTDISPLSTCKSLMLIIFNDTKISSLTAFENLPGLKKVFCDRSLINRETAWSFSRKHPSVMVIFESEELVKWWNEMTPEWNKVFNLYQHISDNPTMEELHQLQSIDSININGRTAITSLAPIERLMRLRKLEFANTTVNSLDPVHNLISLTYINAVNSKVTSLEPLGTLVNLKVLSLEHTQVSDLAPLRPLSNLEMIYADYTAVTVSGANDFMNGNPQCLVIFQTFENTSWWNGLSEAWKSVLLTQAGLKETPDKIQLQQMVNLEKLVINENPGIISLVPALKFTHLKELQFSATGVTNLDAIPQMGSLTILRFPKNPIDDLKPLALMRNLKELDFSNTPVENLEPIQFLSGLEVLKFSGTQVKNLKYIQNMIRLKELEFYNTRVSNLDVLDNIRILKSLKIFNTKVSEKKVEKFKTTHPECEVVFY
ncbi:MAG: hypothetical protein NTX61_18940 [Bacteroidetes bacterium]|nr:hypothetical protein [Bacteroidota bacterium]